MRRDRVVARGVLNARLLGLPAPPTRCDDPLRNSPFRSPSAMSRQEYSRVAGEESIEMSEKAAPLAPKVEEPASRRMVVFSVGFYLVAAIVVRSRARWTR